MIEIDQDRFYNLVAKIESSIRVSLNLLVELEEEYQDQIEKDDKIKAAI